MVTPPNDTYENYNSFSDRCKQIREAIDLSNYKVKVREQLQKIFTEIEFIKQKKSPPSQADIVRLLGIPAATLNGYMKKLRTLAAEFFC